MCACWSEPATEVDRFLTEHCSLNQKFGNSLASNAASNYNSMLVVLNECLVTCVV